MGSLINKWLEYLWENRLQKVNSHMRGHIHYFILIFLHAL